MKEIHLWLLIMKLFCVNVIFLGSHGRTPVATEAGALLENGNSVVLMVIYPTTGKAVISNICRMPTDETPPTKRGTGGTGGNSTNGNERSILHSNDASFMDPLRRRREMVRAERTPMR